MTEQSENKLKGRRERRTCSDCDMRYEGAKRSLIHVIMGHLYSIVMLQKSNLICSEQTQIQIIPIHSNQTGDDSQRIQSICDESELTRVNRRLRWILAVYNFLSYQFFTSWTEALHNFSLLFYTHSHVRFHSKWIMNGSVRQPRMANPWKVYLV